MSGDSKKNQVSIQEKVEIREDGSSQDFMESRLTYPPVPQLELFAEDRRQTEDRSSLVATLDGIRDRFGPSAIRVGRTMSLARP